MVFHPNLDKLKPNWRVIDSNTYFVQWLDKSGARVDFKAALIVFDAKEIVRIMAQWEKLNAGFHPYFDEIKPNWREVDATSEFDQWLHKVNLKTSYVDAARCYDAEECARIMILWETIK